MKLNKCNGILILLFVIFITNRLFSQEAESIPSQSEISLLDSLANVYHQKWINDSTRTDSLAYVYNIPKIIYNNDSTPAAYLHSFYNDTFPVYIGELDNYQAITLKTDRVWPSGGTNIDLTGAGIIIGEWDGTGVRTTHQEFDNLGVSRVEIRDNTEIINNKGHSTHVAGILIGKGVEDLGQNSSKGMAPDARIWDFSFFEEWNEMSSAAAGNIERNEIGLRISNHSYGAKIGWWQDDNGTDHWENNTSHFGDYAYGSNECPQIDNISKNAPYYIIVRAAGNERNENGSGHPSDAESAGYNGSGFGTLMPDAVSKNIITVGAIYGIAGDQQNAEMTDFSSWGPAKDGRLKPDIVADGYQVYSSIATADNAYDSHKSGTSMASPSVAGSIALLLQKEREYYNPRRMLSSTIKALVLHTADDAGNPGPDYKYGWGVMNTEKAVRLMINDHDNKPCGYIREYTLQNESSIEIYIKAIGNGTPLKATICWIDPPGQGSGKDLINDLDLKLVDIDNNNQTYYPWILNPSNPGNNASTGDNTLDNVEQVSITSPVAGHLYKLVINHKNTLNEPQKVSLIFEGYKTQVDNVFIPSVSSPQTINNTKTVFANNIIYLSSYASLNVEAPGYLNCIAGQSVLMSPNFKVNYGSKFKAQIFDCSPDVFSKLRFNNSDVQANSESNIFPNPVSEFVNYEYSLDRDDIVTVKITNFLGVELQSLLNNSHQKQGNHSLQVNVTLLPPGAYFISLVSSNGLKMSKFMVYR